MMPRQQGFTMVEILIAMGIATFLIAGAMTAHVSNLSFYKTTESRSTLYQDSLLLIDFLRLELMSAGGGGVRAWMGLWVEDNCLARLPFPACNGSDRITISSLSVPVQECAITGQVTPTTLQIAFTSPGVCCLQPQAANELSYAGKQVMVTLGDYYAQSFVTGVDLNTCRLTVANGQAAGYNRPHPTPDYSNGTVSMMTVQTVYLDTVTRMLKRFIDANNNGVMDANEDVILADGVFDIQFALGYDFNVPDGNVLDSADGQNDEWLYNNTAGPPEIWGVGVFAPPVVRSQLLAVQVSAIMGSDEAEGNTPTGPRQVLNGPARSLAGWMMMDETARLSPRNAYIFQ